MGKPAGTSMYDWLHDLITPLCANNAALRYQAGEALPDAFAVYYLVSSNPEAFFADRSRRENARYSVAYYDRDRPRVDQVGEQIKAAMQEAGFLYVGRNADIEHSDTNHWSTTYDFRYYEEG